MGEDSTGMAQADLEAHVLADTFWTLADRTNAQNPDPRLVETCVAMHNSGQTDFLQSTEHAAFVELNSWQRWQAFSLIGQVLPKLDATVADVLAFRARILASTGQINEYEFLPAIEKWLGAETARPAEVIALAEQASEPAIAALCAALVAPGQADEARRLAKIYTDDRRRQALHALARTSHLEATEREKTLHLLAGLLDAAPDDDQQNAIVARILADAIMAAEKPVTTTTFDLLTKALTQGGSLTLYQASRTFMFGSPDVLCPEVLTLFLENFQRVPQTDVGTVEGIDHGLRKLTQDERLPQAIEFITLMAGRKQDSFPLKAFDGVLHDMTLGTGERLQRTIIGWLNQGQPRICFQLSHLLQELRIVESPWSADLPALGFTDLEVFFICRRAIGYFLTEEVVAGSLLISAIRTAEPKLAEALTHLLVDPLLMNYGGELRRYLETIGEDDPARPYVTKALKQSDAYRDALGVGMLSEFEVSAERRQLSHHLRSDQMRAASKVARKTSIFADLVTQQYILHGSRTSTWIKDPGGKRQWMDNQMASFGYSSELPRQDVLDPVGLHHRLYDLRFRKPVR